MGNIHPDIKPGGLTQGHFVDLAYQLVAALTGIAAKLDADAGVTDTDYEANAITAIIKGFFYDSKDNRAGTAGEYVIKPTGIDDNAGIRFLTEFMNAFETLTEQLDADAGITETTFEANSYTALFLHKAEDGQGNIYGNGNVFTFRPGGFWNEKELIEWLYNAINAIETLTEALDLGTGVTDVNYEALWYTAAILTKVQNAAGSLLGN